MQQFIVYVTYKDLFYHLPKCGSDLTIGMKSFSTKCTECTNQMSIYEHFSILDLVFNVGLLEILTTFPEHEDRTEGRRRKETDC